MYNLQEAFEQVKARTSHLKGMVIAVMGCIVNGPGEARTADIGLASGKGRAALFAHGETIRTVPEQAMVDELMAEIEARFC